MKKYITGPTIVLAFIIVGLVTYIIWNPGASLNSVGALDASQYAFTFKDDRPKELDLSKFEFAKDVAGNTVLVDRSQYRNYLVSVAYEYEWPNSLPKPADFKPQEVVSFVISAIDQPSKGQILNYALKRIDKPVAVTPVAISLVTDKWEPDYEVPRFGS